MSAAVLTVVPARMAASRLPGKPLADIHGRPMIVHVLERAAAADLGPVILACCEPEVAEAGQAAGFQAVMTDPHLPSGSDRVWQAVERFDPEGAHPTVINLQGDLPTLDPGLLAAALAPLADPAVDISTLVAEIGDPAEIADPNVVKCALALAPGATVGRALYFSRAAVPHGEGPHYHHIGLYAYRRAALARFVSLPAGVLERRERLEQLRALEAGMTIAAARVDTIPLGVDTPADLERARARLSSST